MLNCYSKSPVIFSKVLLQMVFTPIFKLTIFSFSECTVSGAERRSELLNPGLSRLLSSIQMTTRLRQWRKLSLKEMRSKHLLFQVSPRDTESRDIGTQTKVFVGFTGDVKGAASTNITITLLLQLLPGFEFFYILDFRHFLCG